MFMLVLETLCLCFTSGHAGVPGQVGSDTTPPWRIVTMLMALSAHNVIAAHIGACLLACTHACIYLVSPHMGGVLTRQTHYIA